MMRRRLIHAALIVTAALLQGCKATPPGKLERTVMTRAKHGLFVGSEGASNPLASSDKTAAEGKQAFTHYCVACHGMDGQNTGVPFADHLTPPVPSLASADVQSYSDGQLKWVVDNGIAPSGMPAAKGILSDGEQWAIVVFIRHLPPAGSLGEPPMYGN
jgi:mono/diheme cytochrome c family protein